MTGFFESIARMQADGPLLAAWAVDGGAAGARALFARTGDGYAPVCRAGGFPEALAAEICARAAGREGVVECGGARVFLEQISAGKKLVLCGAGHVALSVIRLGAALGYEVTAIEDREAFAEKARAAGAHRVVCRPFGEALDDLPGDAATAFVVMTREHAHDVECLRRILRKPCAYAGMMGSHTRAGRVREQLLAEGYDALAVERLHMPIGLPIGARTPGEIAVSVAAELISVMNARCAGEGFPPGMLEELARLERAEAPSGVLSVIVEKRGEAPRRPGTKMLVRGDGSFLGTVGGGYAEAVILEAAAQMLREGRRESRLIQVSMKKGIMQCGGEIEVLLLPV